MTEERRDRWDEREKSRVRILYGMAVGGFLVASGVGVLVYGIANDIPNPRAVYALGGALCLCGLVAGAPNVWMPVLGALLKKVPWGNRNGVDLTPPPTLTLTSLSDDEPEE